MRKQEDMSFTEHPVKWEEDSNWLKKEEPEYLDQYDDYIGVDTMIVTKTDLESCYNNDQLHTDAKSGAPQYNQDFDQSCSPYCEDDLILNPEATEGRAVANSPVLEHKDETSLWLQCEHCSYSSKFSFALTKHLERRHGHFSPADHQIIEFSCDQPIEAMMWYKCDHSSKGFCCDQYGPHITTMAYLSQHEKNKHMPDEQREWYENDECNFHTKYNIDSITHEDAHLPPNQRKYFQCDICQYRARKKQTLTRHKIKVHLPQDQIKWYECEECNFRCKYKDYLSGHVRRMHLPSDKIKWFHCDECGYRAKRKFHLNKHKLLHMPDDQIEWFQCDECDYRCKYNDRLKCHKKNVHLSPGRVQLHQCDQCEYRAKSKSRLQRHMALHISSNKNTWFDCDQCDFRAITQAVVTKHKKNVHDVQWFECDLCKYKSKTRYALRCHQNSKHLPEDQIQWHQCDQCEYRGKKKNNLKEHMIVHMASDKINWFNCDHCDHKARRKGDLKRHMSGVHGDLIQQVV